MSPLDFITLGVLVSVGTFVFFRRDQFIALTLKYPYLMGMVKFALLATLGSQLKVRLMTGDYDPDKVLGQAIAWALTGAVITWGFRFFGHLGEKLAPGLTGWKLALFKSVLINVVFAYPMMIGHSALELFILNVQLIDLTWETWGPWGFIAKTIIFFWIPAHTFTFSLKKEWQILTAAFLSIVLGVFLAIAA